MSNDTEVTYTEAEWRRREALRQCGQHGHSWNISATFGSGPLMIVCDVCGWSGRVDMGPNPGGGAAS